MNTRISKPQEDKNQAAANNTSKQPKHNSTLQLQQIANNSPQVQQLKAYQAMANTASKTTQLSVSNTATIQRLARPQDYTMGKITNDGFAKNHIAEPGKFTLYSAAKAAYDRGGVNTIINIDTPRLTAELRQMIADVDDINKIKDAEEGYLVKPTAGEYEWITSRPPIVGSKPKKEQLPSDFEKRQEGGKQTMEFGIALRGGTRKVTLPGKAPKKVEQIQIVHFVDSVVNDEEWMREKELANRVSDHSLREEDEALIINERILDKYHADEAAKASAAATPAS